eukprot:CAMPEP_0184317374 /NCGR_PEP_ID=MMETSP1049-20130417/96202_1 /TAXON_ID=77928 /ORGANISM="Proteomonas sulcata, Strain CCMP704" /LENGTH=211 /DNA_ID=CAMNT_0026636739 /DNA_START=919 /DNA_END=1551 /DNA_ORIENTATION=+
MSDACFRMQTRLITGCCFVLFSKRQQALDAIKALHGKHVMPGMQNSVQISFAKGEEERMDAKLFVGMLSKSQTEEDVRQMFVDFGEVEEVYLMKEKGSNTSKGCAFVKFGMKDEAIKAIERLNGKVTMPGNTQSLIVKWADPPKTRNEEQGRGNGMSSRGGGDRDMGGMGGMMAQQLMQQGMMKGMSNMGGSSLSMFGDGPMGGMGGMGSM